MQRSHAALLSLVIGCGCAVDRILHEGGDGGGADGSAEAGGEDGGGAVEGGEDGGGEERSGNFPEPALTECGNLPQGIAPIEGLASAYAVTGPRAQAGEVGPPEALRIRLATFGMEAGDSITVDWDPDGQNECDPFEGEAFAFDIPASMLAVGVQDLANISPAYPEFFEASLGPDCGDGGEAGGGGPVPLGMQGELELFVVTDDCVVGELRGMDMQWPVWNGGFVAMRSELACVPMFHEPAC